MTFVLSLIFFTHRSRTRKLLSPIASELPDAQLAFLTMNASWNGHAVKLSTGGGGRSGPNYVVVEISASAPARLSVWKRTWFPNIRLFVPPRVDVPGTADHIVRSDNAEFAHRMFDDLGALIQTTITRRQDLLAITARRVYVRRTIEDTWRDEHNDGAREAWTLATRIVEYIG